jgi:hypothetical protein
MSFDILKINKIKRAQIEARIPMAEILFFSEKTFSKSNKVMLKMMSPSAKKINIKVKIFIFVMFLECKINELDVTQTNL